MADTHTTSILRKTDPFVLDATISNLENVFPPNHHHQLPLGATAGGKTDEERPYLNTPFNQLDDNKYRSPWKDVPGAETDILELEQSANEVWDAYRQLYYGHDAVGSVYVRQKGSSDKAKKGGALEALFGIQKKCYGDDNGGDETARWDSVHTVTIEVPNFEEGTCEYKIKSSIWCRYSPEDVGDVPRAEKSSKKAAGTSPNKKSNKTEKSKRGSTLEVARLEVFDKAANHWDSKTNNNKKQQPIDLSKGGTPLPPVPAVVTSSAVYTKDTTKVCKVTLSKKKSKAIPVASHIQNIGTLLEKIETDVRSKLERVDAPKCVEVLQGMYRQSLSPGLKLAPSRSKSMGSSGLGMMARLGGHATGMGVGKGLIGEIALKAKSKGLGNVSGEAPQSGSSSTNKAMEGILANEKKKLKDLECHEAPATWTQAGLKKSSSKGGSSSPTSGGSSSASFKPPGAGTLKRPNLRKAASARTFESTKPATPEFMNFRSKLKSTAAK